MRANLAICNNIGFIKINMKAMHVTKDINGTMQCLNIIVKMPLQIRVCHHEKKNLYTNS